MEVTRLTDTSIKIKTKTAILVVDPNNKAEADVILLVDPNDADVKMVTNSRITIEGPGDYEIMDVAIQGKTFGNYYGYTIDDGMSKIYVIPSVAVEKEKDEEGLNALIVKAVEGFDIEKVTSFAPDLCLAFGDAMQIDHATEAKKVNKINVRKFDDSLKGQIVLLRKE